MATNIKLNTEYQQKLMDIKDTYDIEPSNAQVARKSIDLLYDRRVNDGS